MHPQKVKFSVQLDLLASYCYSVCGQSPSCLQAITVLSASKTQTFEMFLIAFQSNVEKSAGSPTAFQVCQTGTEDCIQNCSAQGSAGKALNKNGGLDVK